MIKKTIFLTLILSSLLACNHKQKKDNKLAGNWKLFQAFNAEGQPCSGLNESIGCIYNKDQTWQFKNDSSFVTMFTSIVEVNYGDTIILKGRYKFLEENSLDFLEVKYDKYIDSSGTQKLQIMNLTDSSLEYSKPKYPDGSGGMRLIFKRISKP